MSQGSQHSEGSDACAAVMVCGGARCEHRTDATVELIRPLIRLAPRSILMRTQCPASGTTPCRGPHPTVVLQRCDPGMQAHGPARIVSTGDLCELRREVARWLLSQESDAR